MVVAKTMETEVMNLTRDELRNLIAFEVVDTSGAIEMLGCSRQNIDYLVKQGRLIPVAIYPNTKLFLKDDILDRLEGK